MNTQRKAVVTVLGRDARGIIAAVSAVLTDHNVNILDISQTVLSDMFNMLMLVDVTEPREDYDAIVRALDALGREKNLQIHVQRSEIFDAMYRV